MASHKFFCHTKSRQLFTKSCQTQSDFASLSVFHKLLSVWFQVEEQDAQIRSLQKQLKEAESLLATTIYQVRPSFYIRNSNAVVRVGGWDTSDFLAGIWAECYPQFYSDPMYTVSTSNNGKGKRN